MFIILFCNKKIDIYYSSPKTKLRAFCAKTYYRNPPNIRIWCEVCLLVDPKTARNATTHIFALAFLSEIKPVPCLRFSTWGRNCAASYKRPVVVPSVKNLFYWAGVCRHHPVTPSFGRASISRTGHSLGQTKVSFNFYVDVLSLLVCCPVWGLGVNLGNNQSEMVRTGPGWLHRAAHSACSGQFRDRSTE